MARFSGGSGPAVNLTGFARETYVDDAVSNLVGGASEALDTLSELAAALGDDANFATTVTDLIAEKAPTDSPEFSGTVDFSGAETVDFSGATVEGLDLLPDQTDNEGLYLTTDGTEPSWTEIDTTPKPISSNYVLNGGFDIWQRGTSRNHTSLATLYGADRWATFRPAFAAGASSSRREVFLVPGVRYSMRIQRQQGNTSTASITTSQPLESQNSIGLVGRSATLSFWARRGSNFSATSNQLLVAIGQGSGTDEVYWRANSFVHSGDPVSLTTDWQKFTVTADIGLSASQVAIRFIYNPTGTAGINDWYEIAAVQLESGDHATPFRRHSPSIQDELLACQRYYWSLDPFNAQTVGFGYGHASSSIRLAIPAPAHMRGQPTMNATGSYSVRGAGTVYTTPVISGVEASPAHINFIVSILAGNVAVSRSYIFVTADLVEFESEMS